MSENNTPALRQLVTSLCLGPHLPAAEYYEWLESADLIEVLASAESFTVLPEVEVPKAVSTRDKLGRRRKNVRTK